MTDCLFCRIASGEIQAKVVDQGEEWVAFRDIDPRAPTHVLIVPREHVATTNEIGPEHDALVGRMVRAAAAIAREEGVADDGYRLVLNCNRGAGQSVWHIHLHLLGGRELSWPPG